MYNTNRLTNGPKHHFFGFHDLFAWNSNDDRLICLQVDEINHAPMKGEKARVGYVDNEKIFVQIGETNAFNFPQGARQQWLADTNLFTVNNQVGAVWGTNLYDSNTSKLIESYEMTTHCLSPDGKFGYGLDYARLYHLGMYGYNGILDKYANEIAPSKSGIWKHSLETRECDLLVSVAEVANFEIVLSTSTSFNHYLTHAVLNPSGTRLAFLHRFITADKGGITRLMTIGSDGKGLRCIASGSLSHFDWKDDDNIYIWGRANSSLDSIRVNPIFSIPAISWGMQIAKKILRNVVGNRGILEKCFIMVSDEENPTISKFAIGKLTEDGHPMTCPSNSNVCVIDNYPDKAGLRTLMLYYFDENKCENLGQYMMLNEKPDPSKTLMYLDGIDEKVLSTFDIENLSFTRSGLHCDLHPRWNKLGTKVAFDSIHEGSRQIYSIDFLNNIPNET